uniref:Uncharacterized protein n=1 Tax=viral metagenome TaxID=1070528 RepID=A0A6M3IVL1_9ZZZZ
MGIINTSRRQTAVYWPPTGGRDRFGKVQYGTAIELRVRWEDVQEEFIDENGTRQLSKSLVYVGEDLMVGGVLWLGTLATVEHLNDPKANDGAFEIKGIGKLPNLKATEFLRTCFL